MCHETGGSNGRRSGIGNCVDLGTLGDKILENTQLPGDGSAPKRSNAVDRSVVRYLVETPLLDVRVANFDQVLNDLQVSTLASNEKGRAAILEPAGQLP